MQDSLAGKLPVDTAQETKKLLMPVALVKVADDFALQQIERGEQGGGSIPFVVVRQGTATAFLQRQAGLSAIQSLNLALFVDTKHDRLFRRFR